MSRLRTTRNAARGLLVSAVFAGLVLAAGPASAHSVLLSTTPQSGASPTTAPDSVALTFNEEPRGEYSAIHVTGPDGKRRDAGAVQVIDDVVTEQLAGTRPAGRYVVDWRVVSTDGHPVSGQFSYTAKAAAAPLAARAETVATSTKSSGSGVALVIGIVAAVVILGGIVVWFTRRSRRTPVHE